MSTIPTSAFADRLQTLNRDEFQSFVADLWSLAGWETSIDGDVLVARRGGREQRLLVLPPGRLAQFRLQTPSADQFDRVVTPGVENADSTSFGGVEVSLVDAHDLRHRLIYGCESDAAEQLWSSYFDDPLRGTSWERPESPVSWAQAGLVVVSLLLVGAAIAVLMLGLPFLESDPAVSQTAESPLVDGLNLDIDLEPADQTVGEPSAIAWGTTVYAGTEEGTVAAIDGETGESVWTTEHDVQVQPPLVANGTVYVRSLTGVHALDAVTGERQWNFTDLDPDWSHYDVFSSTSTRLTVVDGTVYFSDAAKLLAVDADTGEERWNAPLSSAIAEAPLVYNGTVYVVSPDDGLQAYNATTGNQSWQAEYREGVFQTSGSLNVYRSTEANDSVLISDGSVLFELDAETGAEGWVFESNVFGDLSAPVVLDRGASLGLDRNATNANDSTVYVADHRSYVYALDPETGERYWEYQEPAMTFEYVTAGQPLGNETAYSVYLVGNSPIVDAESTILAVNASSGAERWRVEAENSTVASPTTVDGTLYAGTDNGELLALDTTDGTEQWRVDAFDGAVSGAVAVATEPLGGDSVDSRIRLGIEGHHDWLVDREESGSERGDGISVIDADVPEVVAAGEKLDVRVSVTNQGDSRANTTIAVEPEWDGTPESVLRAEIDLAPGEARELTFSFALPEETGTYRTEVRVGDDRDERTVTVTERPTHEVTGLDDPDTVWQEDETEIIASVRNTGEVAATTPIALEFNGEIVDSTQRTIAPNETVSVTFSLSPGDVPAGVYNYSVATNDHAQSEAIEVLAVDRREDALPIVNNVFGLTLLLSGLAIGWWVLTDIRGSVSAREQRQAETTNR